jgi:hypothetical protein
MAVTRGIFNLLMETMITRPLGDNFWETMDLVLRDGQPYARLRTVESDLEEHPNRPAHPTTVHALLTTKSGASWRVDMTPTLRYYDRWMRRIPPIAYPVEAGAQREAKAVMRDLLAPFNESDDVRVKLTATVLLRADPIVPVGSQWLGRLDLQIPPRVVYGGRFLLRLFWAPS